MPSLPDKQIPTAHVAGARNAGVLVPLIREPTGRTTLVLIHRAAGGLHGDQIGLPGGACDGSAESPRDAAVRETCEEIGAHATGIEILESLPTVYAQVSGFVIHPFVAMLLRPPAWRPEPREVRAVLEVDVAELASPDSLTEGEFDVGGGRRRVFPYLRLGEHRIWGVTYRILRPLLPGWVTT
jgi:8-oxo-dGTP pyrophosphatase MutT (NUDIX family)